MDTTPKSNDSLKTLKLELEFTEEQAFSLALFFLAHYCSDNPNVSTEIKNLSMQQIKIIYEIMPPHVQDAFKIAEDKCSNDEGFRKNGIHFEI